ncbi:glycosyltransferase [Reichenbachiella sp.]
MDYLKNKSILIISPESWNHIHVSKHHYAKSLSTSNKVYFLNPPSNQDRVNEISEHLHVVDYKKRIKGIHLLPNFLSGLMIKREWSYLTKKIIQSPINVVWNFDPSRFFNLSKISGVYKIAHIVDLNQVFKRQILSQTANLRLTVSEKIRATLSTPQFPYLNLGHGFQQHNQKDYNKQLPGNNKTKAVYIGNLIREAVDWQLLLEVACQFEHVDFVFFGPDQHGHDPSLQPIGEQVEKVRALSNCYFQGKIDSEVIPSLLNQADIQLITFKEAYHHEQTNSHKILEYMTSGRVIVATYTQDFENDDPLIVMSKKNAEFVDNFKRVVENLDNYNSMDHMKARQKIAADNSYGNKIRQIDQLITQQIGNR